MYLHLSFRNFAACRNSHDFGCPIKIPISILWCFFLVLYYITFGGMHIFWVFIKEGSECSIVIGCKMRIIVGLMSQYYVNLRKFYAKDGLTSWLEDFYHFPLYLKLKLLIVCEASMMQLKICFPHFLTVKSNHGKVTFWACAEAGNRVETFWRRENGGRPRHNGYGFKERYFLVFVGVY